ncbi:hypothetical protein D9M73_271400 [compost metagenome]
MAVDVFERITVIVGDRHEFNDTDVRVTGNARGFVKLLPTFEVVPNGVGQLADKGRDTNVMHQVGHGWNINEIRHAAAPVY